MNSLAFYSAAWLFPHIEVESWQVAVLAAFVLALTNLIIRPFLLLLALPISFLTLGLFTLIINAWMVMLTSSFVSGLGISGFWDALLVSIIIFIYSILFKPMLKKKS
jgi:putative membrane protein